MRTHATRGYSRTRICSDCGVSEKVREDNKSNRCARCASYVSLSKARSVKYRRTPANIARCKVCGGGFRSVPSRKAIYCSKSCRRSDKNVDRTCVQCQTTFSVTKSVINHTSNARGNFCCRECYNEFLHTGLGRFNRGPRWRAIRKQAIKMNPFCALCGTAKNLHVHHIIPYRISKNNSQENLIPLCRRDHKRVEYFFLKLEPLEEQMDPEIMLWHRSYSLVEQQTITRYRLVKLMEGEVHEEAKTAVNRKRVASFKSRNVAN